ncbi:MAG: hypothetical protein ACRESK_09265 [Gammaproteobacteria bacterium]
MTRKEEMIRMMGKALPTVVIITLLIAILLAVTNPKKENHIEAIKNRLDDRDAVTTVINRGLLALKPPEYHTVAIFSYTKWDNRITSIGGCGYVWVDVTSFK